MFKVNKRSRERTLFFKKNAAKMKTWSKFGVLRYLPMPYY